MKVLIVTVDEEYGNEEEIYIVFLLKLAAKEIIDLGNAKLILSFFLPNRLFILSDILVLTRIGTATRSLTVVETEFKESIASFGNSNLCCLKLSEFSILETLTYTLSAPIVLVLLLSKLFLQSLNNNNIKWLDWKVTYKTNFLCVFDTQNNNLVKSLLTH